MLHGADQLSEFETLGAFAWLEPIAFDRRRENVTEAIEMIVDRDARQGTRLLETLQVFLDARRLKEAADRLFVHRNTLRYRLDAISKLTGHDVQDPDGRLVLELQLRLAMVHGAIPTLEERSDLVVSEAPDVITLDDALVEPGPLAEEPSSN
jgi:sugar diacid utilization regulator